MAERPPCRGQTDLFFSSTPADIDAARTICATCHRVVACLHGALLMKERFGVWGGLDADERRVLLAELGRRHRAAEAGRAAASAAALS